MQRRLMFLDSHKTYWSTLDGIQRGNTGLLFDLDYDNNLRSYSVYAGTVKINDVPVTRIPVFSPTVDGIINGEIRDQDDGAALKANLACSIKNPGACQ